MYFKIMSHCSLYIEVGPSPVEPAGRTKQYKMPAQQIWQLYNPLHVYRPARSLSPRQDETSLRSAPGRLGGRGSGYNSGLVGGQGATVSVQYTGTVPVQYLVTVPVQYTGTLPVQYSGAVPVQYSGAVPVQYLGTVPSSTVHRYSSSTVHRYGSYTQIGIVISIAWSFNS